MINFQRQQKIKNIFISDFLCYCCLHINLVELFIKQLRDAAMLKPPYKFGTVPNGSTDVNLKNNFPDLSRYMYAHGFNYDDATKGVSAVKNG